MNVALLVSEFHAEVASRMLEAAEARAASLGLRVAAVCRVPGAYDLPVVADALLARADVDAVVALGAVVRGGTRHDEVIAAAAARELTAASVRRGKPVALGVTGPGMSERQAYARIRPAAERAVEAAARVHEELGRARGR